MIMFMFFLYSCNYPDIDSVPNFNFKKTIQEKCSFDFEINIEDRRECEIFNRL